MTTRDDLIKAAATVTGQSQATCDRVLRALLDIIPSHVASGRTVEFRGRMTFYRAYRKARPVQDIKRGQQMWMNGRYVMLCRWPGRRVP